ncbi:MAG: transcriptional repressor, partial [Sneathiella sp.]
NIKNLLEDDLIRAVELPGQNPRYELTGLPHHHYFQCRQCNMVFDVEKCPGTLSDLAPPGFKVEGHEIVLYGRCSACAFDT